MSSDNEFASLTDEDLAKMIVDAGGKVHDGATRAQLENAAARLLAGEEGVDTFDDVDQAAADAAAAAEAAKKAEDKAAAKKASEKQAKSTPVLTKAAPAPQREEMIPVRFLKGYFPEEWPENFRPRKDEFDHIRAGETLNLPLSLFQELRAKATPPHKHIRGDTPSHIVERDE